jgi:hypothetical protein
MLTGQAVAHVSKVVSTRGGYEFDKELVILGKILFCDFLRHFLNECLFSGVRRAILRFGSIRISAVGIKDPPLTRWV